MLHFADPVDKHGVVADLADLWSYVAPSITLDATGGRWGGKAIHMPDDADYATPPDMPAPGIGPRGSPTNPIHVAWHGKAVAAPSTTTMLIKFLSTVTGAEAGLQVGASGLLQGRNLTDTGSTSTFGSAADVSIVDGSYHDIEVRAAFDPVDGFLQVWIDGVLKINFSGDNVYNGDLGDTGFDRVEFHGVNNSSNGYKYDDPLVWDEDPTGDSRTEFKHVALGQHRMWVTEPTGDGAHGDFTPTGSGSTHADRVSEDSADEDTTYVEGATAGMRDSYTTGGIADTPAFVRAYVVTARMKNPDLGSKTAGVGVARSAGEHVQDFALSSAYKDYQACIVKDPATGGAWTLAGANAAELLLKVAD